MKEKILTGTQAARDRASKAAKVRWKKRTVEDCAPALDRALAKLRKSIQSIAVASDTPYETVAQELSEGIIAILNQSEPVD